MAKRADASRTTGPKGWTHVGSALNTGYMVWCPVAAELLDGPTAGGGWI